MSIHMTDDEREELLSQPAVLRHLANFNRRKLALVEPKIGIDCEFDYRIDAKTHILQTRIRAYESLAFAIETIDARRALEAQAQ